MSDGESALNRSAPRSSSLLLDPCCSIPCVCWIDGGLKNDVRMKHKKKKKKRNYYYFWRPSFLFKVRKILAAALLVFSFGTHGMIKRVMAIACQLSLRKWWGDLCVCQKGTKHHAFIMSLPLLSLSLSARTSSIIELLCLPTRRFFAPTPSSFFFFLERSYWSRSS